ncbi:hypothetical protein EVAR_28327_1 [Eumeta japonica]|uniref:Uncharacterized protein n=1 Tax=Eumeta variegata TaxID=151549 RepID=A0A4C1V8C8_EUMVA|nr:hypothetical protein EVAR_28327_1 [Eumeta japonica]
MPCRWRHPQAVNARLYGIMQLFIWFSGVCCLIGLCSLSRGSNNSSRSTGGRVRFINRRDERGRSCRLSAFRIPRGRWWRTARGNRVEFKRARQMRYALHNCFRRSATIDCALLRVSQQTLQKLEKPSEDVGRHRHAMTTSIVPLSLCPLIILTWVTVSFSSSSSFFHRDHDLLNAPSAAWISTSSCTS